jgi:hypothetical protein
LVDRHLAGRPLTSRHLFGLHGVWLTSILASTMYG